jgi:Ca-activated chloride channel homolog
MMRFNQFRNATVVVAVVTFAGTATIDAQGPAFKSGVEMVPLTVTVTDTAGKYVKGLTGNDFEVFEDGVQQHLTFFASEEVPVDVALLLDTSSSMGLDLPLVQSAAIGLVRKLRPNDRAAVVNVKESAGIPQPFTGDRAAIERAIRGLCASGETALYDGVYVVLKEFERERKAAVEVRRQALVLLTDGFDTRSRLAVDDVLDLARRVHVNIYVIALRTALAQTPRTELDSMVLRADYSLNTVTRETGGRLFFPKTVRDLSGIYTAIAQELFSQYELGYMPVRSGEDGSFKRVAVRLRPETNAFARTRSGYYASRARPGL